MLIETLVVGPLQVNCYLIACPVTAQALVIDPGAEGERILAALQASGLTLAAVVNTHGHFDHIGANRFLVERTGAPLMLHAGDQPLLRSARQHAAQFGLHADLSPEPDRLLVDGDRVNVGELEFEVLHIPGHSLGGICLYGHGHLFVGDTLFAGSVGRTDLPGGDHARLIAGIRQRLLPLPAATVVHPGHGPATEIGREVRNNPFL
jgi:glyoxylase-like metal-dependent hydrolase (beta-lactamase superfamily II)